ncbi:MAG: hypothetical protein J5703_00960, partial [Methanomicrobium sp.]|nr:hypothetical protein [Methanomicrobium sp.]
YYDMDASLKAGEIDYQWYKISDKFDDSIKACKGMLKAPDSFCANTTSDKDEYTCWIEFLSSVDYLYHNKPENVTEKEIKEFLKEKKGSIVKDFDKCFESAYKTLLENNLISDN